MKAQEGREPVPADRPVHGWGELRDLGVLWLVNRAVFHPRGYALAIEYAQGPHPVGWALLGPGDEPYTFAGDPDSEDTEHRRFVAVERLMREASEHGRAPHEHPPGQLRPIPDGDGAQALTDYLRLLPAMRGILDSYLDIAPEQPDAPVADTPGEQRAFHSGGMVALAALFAPAFGVSDPEDVDMAVRTIVRDERARRAQ